MFNTWGNDDFDIDERTGDFNCMSEAYGYDREEKLLFDDDDDDDLGGWDDSDDDDF